MSDDLIELMQNLGQPRVLVVGDVMLDRYVWGDARRISQESPVILLHADRREERLGGASSVATMLRASGQVAVAGVVGPDADADRMRQTLTDLGIDHEGVVTDSERPTTVKERFIGRAQHRHPQQMIRVDYEVRTPVPAPIEAELCQVIAQQLRRPTSCSSAITTRACVRQACWPRPSPAQDWGCAARRPHSRVGLSQISRLLGVTPNRLEASLATGRDLAGQCRGFQGCHAVANAARSGSGGHHVGQGWHGAWFIATAEADFPDPATAGLRHHRRGRHGVERAGVGPGGGRDYDAALALANVAGGLEVEKSVWPP